MTTEYLRTWEITLLSPLHIGDGETLFQGMDYIPAKDGLQVIHIDKVLESVADNPRAVNDLGKMKLGEFIKSYKLNISPEYTLKAAGGVAPAEIRRFTKSAYGEPYLPGSTLKGAIRTSLWTTLNPPKPHSLSVGDFKQRERNLDDYKKKVKRLTGEPQCDFLRPLSISDSIGIPAKSNMKAQEIKFFNIRIGNEGGWKDIPSRKTMPSYEKAAGVFVEAIPAGKRFHVRASLDYRLLTEPYEKIWPLPKAKGLSGFSSLAQAINDHSQEAVNRELDFFKKYSETATGATGVVNYYEGLLEAFKQVGNKKESFLIRLAWGIGWRGMTGDWLRDSDLAEVRKIIKPPLGKSGFDIFPKTRRLAMEDGSPKSPLGWVLVRPVEDHFFVPRKPKTATVDSGSREATGTVNASALQSKNTLEPKMAERKAQTETWRKVLLIYSSNDGRIACQYSGKNADTKDKNLVPESLRSSLFKNKKRATATTLEVELIGGTVFRILKIEG